MVVLIVAWTAVSLLCRASSHLTVRHSQLQPCRQDERVCVSDLRDCDLRPPASVQKTLNMTCYYQEAEDGGSSMTCDWSREPDRRTEPGAALIFSSEDKIISCQGLFVPATVLNVTVRTTDFRKGVAVWSQPHTVFLYDAVKPLQPVVSLVGSADDSLVVSWRSGRGSLCLLRYRLNSTRVWSQAPVSVQARQTVTRSIGRLLPFSVYRVGVACRGASGTWSDWSADVSGQTLDRAPPQPAELCYRVESSDAAGRRLLHLMWKAADPREAEGRILGYQVSCEPDGLVQNVTEVMAVLVVGEGNCSVTVTAFNTAGHGPAARLQVDTHSYITPPSIRNLWISSFHPVQNALLVQWTTSSSPTPVAPPISHYAVQWRSETSLSSSRWSRVDTFATSVALTVAEQHSDVDPDRSYLISVSSVSEQLCGSPQSLSASLQQGALVEAFDLKVAAVTQTTVSVVWAWQSKSRPIRVQSYRAMLRRGSDRQILSLWPDQWQHTFINLTPSAAYSLVLLVDNVSTNVVPVTTYVDEAEAAVEVAVAVAAAAPLLLLAVSVFIISVLSRTVYKSFFFPPVCSPQGSTTGQWLMDPNHQTRAERNILDIEDFQVNDVLGEKSDILVGPHVQLPSEEKLQEDASPLSIGRLAVRLSTLKLDAEYVSTEHQLSCNLDAVFLSEDNREADAALLQHAHQVHGRCPQNEEEDVREASPQSEHHSEEIVPESGLSGCSLICEMDYVANSSFRAA